MAKYTYTVTLSEDEMRGLQSALDRMEEYLSDIGPDGSPDYGPDDYHALYERVTLARRTLNEVL